MDTELITVPLYGAVRQAIGFVFVCAGLAKLLHPRELSAALADYIPVSPLWRGVAAGCLISVELFLGVLHIVDGWTFVAAAAGLGLLIIFLLFVGYRLATKVRGKCLCFGVRSSEETSGESVIRLGLMIGGELFILAAGTGTVSAGADYPRDVRSAIAQATAAVLLVVCGSWLTRIRQLSDVCLRGTVMIKN